ncbi:hypothetical protein DYBT9275_00357 [Dyadobacter sp. CECT 9275]|uniref:DUF3592 domain-containing protein n=1 Tax=Dyadobacter helix TaxID=2822344 RepID=A0A916J8B4_9BACT|nr:DUF3592 domain-containing protein [Dyadobacter sp. CECT 9275]CAG4989723.1 hypothetical protein DYBT9275_00357 [Dyadobacter sp. CECT 9275]
MTTRTNFSGGDLFIMLFFVIGLTLCSAAYYFYQKGRYLIDHGIKVKGLVIGMHRIQRYEYPVAPSIRFMTREGKERVWHSSEGRNPPQFEVGQEVVLHYNPNDPDEVQLENDYLLVYVFGGIGSVSLLLSVWEIGGAIRALWGWLFGSP